MKKYFFLGFGIGFILSGIIFKYIKFEDKTKFTPIKSETKTEKKINLENKNVTKDTGKFKNMKYYYIQIGNDFKYYENGLTIKNNLKAVELNIVKEENIYKVITKEMKDCSEAEEMAEFLKNEYNLKNVYIKEKEF